MSTGRPLDHIVLAVHDLDAAAKVYEKSRFYPDAACQA